MLAEKYIQEKRRQERKKGREEGLEKGREEGLEKGREEGREKGREEERKAWTAWNQRRIEAEQAGVAFAEPPPGASGQR